MERDKETGDLFGEAYARHDDPDTAHEAAEVMNETGQATRLEGEVRDYLARGGRWTVPEIAEALGYHMWSISPRMAPLERKQLIVRDGKKPVLNSSGRVRELQAWKAKGD